MRFFYIVLFFLGAVYTTTAQTPDPSIDKLVVNSSPAFILLGVQPDNIQRPSTPRDFIGTVQSSVVNKQLQPNFALETNPFNWKKNRRANQFYGEDYFYKSKDAIKRNFALSLATSSSDTVVFGKLQPGLGIGYGLRFTIVPGKVNTTLADAYFQWEMEEIKSMFLSLVQSDVILGSANFSVQEIDDYYAKVAKHVNDGIVNGRYVLGGNKKRALKELKALSESYKNVSDNDFAIKLPKDIAAVAVLKANDANLVSEIASKKGGFERQGFILEFAAAGVTVFQNNQWAGSHYGKTAVWLTPSYRFSIKDKDDDDELRQSLDIMGVLRYMWNDKKVDTGHYFDGGVKLQFNKIKWNASFEGVARRATKVPAEINSNWTYCWLSSFSYTLNQATTLKFSFGSNFDGNTTRYTDKKEMFAVGGINMGIF